MLFGIESGDDNILKKLKKGISVEQNRKAITMAKKAGLEVRADFLVGTPYETRESLQKTLEFALASSVDFAHFNIYKNYYGSELYQMFPSDSSKHLSVQEKVTDFISEGMTAKQFFKYIIYMNLSSFKQLVSYFYGFLGIFYL